MGVSNAPSGRPILALTGGAKARLAAITPAGFRAEVHVSLTDDFPLAQAFVIISAERDDTDMRAANQTGPE
jgi:holo-[acyl-carrier protein] synthase